MADVQVLDRKTAIPQLTSPTGRKFGVRQYAANPGLYEIHFDDKKPGELPTEFQNHKFTQKKVALEYLTKYLTDFWNTSDKNKK